MDLLSMLKPYGKRMSVEDLGLYILPQEFAPRNSTLVDQSRSIIAPTGTLLAASSTIAFEYRVPANRRGRMRRLAVDVVDPALISNITFSIQRSNAPVPNYQLVEAPIGTINVPDEVNVVFDGDQLMQVVVFNSNTFVAVEVHVRVVGHFWDVLEERGR